MKQEQKIYYAIAGFSLLLGWLVAAAILVINAFPSQDISTIDKVIGGFYLYLVNWKLYAFVSLIFGIKAALLNENRSFKNTALQSVFYIILLVVLSTVNAITMAYLPVAIAYMALYFYQKQSRLLMSFSVLIFILLTTFFSLFVFENSFLSIAFSDLAQTKMTGVSFENILLLLIKPEQLFGFSFGITLLFIGYWIGKSRWFFEYHFLYNELKKLFKLSLTLLLLWFVLNHLGVYHYISHWKIGKIFFILDGFAVQLICMFMYIFILMYFENSRWGLKLLKLLENAGRGWFYQVIALFGYMLLFSVLYAPNNSYLATLAALVLYILLALLIKSSPKTGILK